MTITRPDDVREQAERQAKAAGFASVNDYLADLMREDVGAGAEAALDTHSGYTHEELGRLLDAAKDGPWLPMDEAFWEEERRRLLDRAARLGISE